MTILARRSAPERISGLSPDVPGRATGAGADRDPALDLLRTVALARVVLWHASAATWMTVFAAMPIMFFVAGHLLGGEQPRFGIEAWSRKEPRGSWFRCAAVEGRPAAAQIGSADPPRPKDVPLGPPAAS